MSSRDCRKCIEKHRESQPASPGRTHRGFTHVRTPRSGQTTQEHKRFAKGGGSKKVQLAERIKKEHCKLKEFGEYPGVYDDAIREDITKRIDALNDELATRQESINLPKGRLKSQITSFRETIAKVLDSNTSLGEKIQTLSREQGIMIASILKAIGMAIGVLVEALEVGVVALR